MPCKRENTIYRDETGFNEKYKLDIDFAGMKLVAVLNESDSSSIFHVKYYDKPRVLKVFHNNEDPGYADDGVRDLNRTRCEIRAYCSLKKFGICDSGFVPRFYGYTLSVDPNSWKPHLHAFQQDINLPSAILIEHLPDPIPMNSVTYSKQRFEKANIGIRQIHSDLIEHNDPYPKNVLIVPGNPERVIWVDFDVAIVYPSPAYIGEKERGWIEFETRCVESYGIMLEKDQKDGLPPNTKYY